MQQTDFAFKSLQYTSGEEGSVAISDVGVEIYGQVEGEYERKIFSLYYELLCDEDWNVSEFTMDIILGKQTANLQYRKEDDGNWYKDDMLQPDLAGCTYIDITATPLTNSLPIRHLHSAVGERVAIKVLYVDVFEQAVSAKEQFYTKLSATQYRFEQPADNFTAMIEVDADGIVTNYPGMFERIAD